MMTMFPRRLAGALALTLPMAMAMPAGATEIGFTGGTALLGDASTRVTDGNAVYGDVAWYEEDGFRFSNIGDGGFIGNYYYAGEDVFHTHWLGGHHGNTRVVRVGKIDGSAFDLNSFDLTSNNDFGGSPASGNERVYLHASLDGVNSSYTVLLPPEDWGLPGVSIALGAQFRQIKAFWFVPANVVACFGIDNVLLDDPHAGRVPEPGGLAVFALGLAAAMALRRRRGKC